MGVAYVDTSVLAAIAFNEPDAASLIGRLGGFTRVTSSILLEAELRSAFARERRRWQQGFLSGIEWVLPRRPLTGEIDVVLDAGYLRGADLLHMASALYAAKSEQGMAFLTLYRRLSEVAKALGFQV